MRATAGRDVLIVDADRQGSASYWAEAREKQDLPPVASVQKFGGGLMRAVSDMARRYSDLVIDVAAGDSREIEGALRTADQVIIPVQPAGLDVWTLGIIDERVGEAKAANPTLEAFVVINRASPNPRDRDVDEAREAICECENFVVSDVVVRERVTIKRAAPKGLTVVEYRPLDQKAVEELEALYRLAFREG
jgi:chromosome partitioning protein